jgi:hypothetical protein
MADEKNPDTNAMLGDPIGAIDDANAASQVDFRGT